MRTSLRHQITRFSSTLVALALLGGGTHAHAASGRGAKAKGSGRASPSKSTSPSSAPSSTEAAPASAPEPEKSSPVVVADPFAEPSSDAAPPPPPAPSPPALPPPAVGATPTDEPPELAAPAAGGGILERLPASAFPEPYTRGLFGSSLWLTMHGQQWPYYPRTGIGISGSAWVDNAYAKTRIGDVGQSPNLTKYIQQGRAVLRVTPTYSQGPWFAQAQFELVGSKDQTQTQPGLGAAADTDDMWVRAGLWNTFDITVGRFEAFEVYHLGMGLDLNTFERIGAVDNKGPGVVPQVYGATYLFYRPNGPGNLAAHLYIAKMLRFELLGQWGNDTLSNVWGIRPALIFDVGWLKLKGAGEWTTADSPDPAPAMTNTSKRRGSAGSAQLVFAPWIEAGVNIGKGTFDVLDFNGVKAGLSGDTISYGGFANARPLKFIGGLLIGAGYNFAKSTTLMENAGMHNSTSNTQAFLAVQYLAGGQLFIKLVGGYARTSFSTPGAVMSGYDNDQYSIRLRLMYLF
jgi:hypothetical protein